jgi:hypothetical protein
VIHDPPIAFRERTDQAPGLGILVNFGVFAGREATAAEIDDLARDLLPEVHEVSIVSEQRHEIGEDVEAALHVVRIEVADDHLPADEAGVEALADRLIAAASRWARTCIAERHAEVTEL